MLRYHSRDQNTYNTDLPPISRTIRYKKFTKPLLERKRRARMNKCLDELKLLVGTLEAEGENINKLEKADILELTVRYIKRISRLQDPVREAHRFQAGFSQCASEACKFLLSLPGLNSAVGNRLIDHLQQCLTKPRFHHQDNEHRLQMPSDSRSSTPSSTSSAYADSSRNDFFNSSLSINRTNFPNELNESLSKMNQHLKDHEENGNSMWRPW